MTMLTMIYRALQSGNLISIGAAAPGNHRTGWFLGLFAPWLWLDGMAVVKFISIPPALAASQCLGGMAQSI